MLGYPGGVQRGTSVPPHPSRILGQASDGGSCRGILWGIFKRFLGGDSVGPNVPQNFQCGGTRSGVSLDLVGNRRRGREGWVGKGGAKMRCLFLRG